MADQTTLKVGAHDEINSPLVDGVIGNLGDLASNIATLAELQTKLALVDLKHTAGRAAIPAGMIGAAVVLLFGAMPVVLIGAAELIIQFTGLSQRGPAYLLVAGAALALAAILVLLGLPGFTASFASFSRSTEELTRNVAWLKTVISNSGRTPAHRRR